MRSWPASSWSKACSGCTLGTTKVVFVDGHINTPLSGCRSKPPTAQSSEDLQQWMCTVHNAVNRTLDKPVFNCRFASQRWGALDCDDQMACSLSLGHSKH